MTLAEMLDKLERGKIGHAEAMRWLGSESLNELVETVHANGRQMPGHRPFPLSPETLDVLRQVIVRPSVERGPTRHDWVTSSSKSRTLSPADELADVRQASYGQGDESLNKYLL